MGEFSFNVPSFSSVVPAKLRPQGSFQLAAKRTCTCIQLFLECTQRTQLHHDNVCTITSARVFACAPAFSLIIIWHVYCSIVTGPNEQRILEQMTRQVDWSSFNVNISILCAKASVHFVQVRIEQNAVGQINRYVKSALETGRPQLGYIVGDVNGSIYYVPVCPASEVAKECYGNSGVSYICCACTQRLIFTENKIVRRSRHGRQAQSVRKQWI